MLMTAPFDDERVTTAQRAKLAYIYWPISMCGSRQ